MEYGGGQLKVIESHGSKLKVIVCTESDKGSRPANSFTIAWPSGHCQAVGS